MRRIPALALLSALLLAAPACHREEDSDDSFASGDYNLDGLADVAVGAPFDDAGGAGPDRGRVYVYPGPLSGTTITLSGSEDGGNFGFSVASLGDFNGDGRPDLAVGAPLDDGDGDAADSGNNAGRVFIFLGGATFPAGMITLTGTVPAGQFGFSVARAGDVDGNGSDDLLVGAPFEGGGGTERGRAHLFLGGSSPPTTPALTFTGNEDLGHFGFSVSTAGLLNNDSFFDWMIGAPGDDADGNSTDETTDRGRVFVYHGAAFPDLGVELIMNGSEDFGEFGTSVAGVFDINLDGRGDLLVGAPFEDGDGNAATNTGPFVGRAYLFFGSALQGVSTISSFGASRIFTGTEADGEFGAFVAWIGDANGGGAGDLFIGAPGDDGDANATDEGEDRGRGFIHYGGTGIDTTPDLIVTGTEIGARLGAWAGTSGDVDGDGETDFAVGAPGDDVDGNGLEDGLDRGRVLFFRGGPSVDSAFDASLEGALENGAEAGTSGA